MQRMKIINIKKTYSNFYLFQYVDILCLDLSFSPDIKIAQSDIFVVENVKKLYQQGPFSCTIANVSSYGYKDGPNMNFLEASYGDDYHEVNLNEQFSELTRMKPLCNIHVNDSYESKSWEGSERDDV